MCGTPYRGHGLNQLDVRDGLDQMRIEAGLRRPLAIFSQLVRKHRQELVLPPIPFVQGGGSGLSFENGASTGCSARWSAISWIMEEPSAG